MTKGPKSASPDIETASRRLNGFLDSEEGQTAISAIAKARREVPLLEKGDQPDNLYATCSFFAAGNSPINFGSMYFTTDLDGSHSSQSECSVHPSDAIGDLAFYGKITPEAAADAIIAKITQAAIQ